MPRLGRVARGEGEEGGPKPQDRLARMIATD